MNSTQLARSDTIPRYRSLEVALLAHGQLDGWDIGVAMTGAIYLSRKDVPGIIIYASPEWEREPNTVSFEVADEASKTDGPFLRVQAPFGHEDHEADAQRWAATVRATGLLSLYAPRPLSIDPMAMATDMLAAMRNYAEEIPEPERNVAFRRCRTFSDLRDHCDANDFYADHAPYDNACTAALAVRCEAEGIEALTAVLHHAQAQLDSLTDVANQAAAHVTALMAQGDWA